MKQNNQACQRSSLPGLLPLRLLWLPPPSSPACPFSGSLHPSLSSPIWGLLHSPHGCLHGINTFIFVGLLPSVTGSYFMVVRVSPSEQRARTRIWDSLREVPICPMTPGASQWGATVHLPHKTVMPHILCFAETCPAHRGECGALLSAWGWWGGCPRSQLRLG